MYSDLSYKARNDKSFQKAFADIVDRDKAAAGKLNSSTTRVQCMRDIYKLCNFNPSFIIPWFFPKYPKYEPLSLSRRPYAYAMFDLNVGGYTCLRGSRQIAKSTNFVARQLINAEIMPRWNSLYLAPHPQHTETYANRMSIMRKSFRYFKRDHKLRQNLYYHETAGGSIIDLDNVYTSVDHIRGRSTDEILWDEYQLMDTTFEEEILMTQGSSERPVNMFAGTATTVDSPLERRYAESSGGVWMIRAHGFKDGWLSCNDADDVISAIQPEGLSNPAIKGRRLDVMDGEWVHGNPRMLAENCVGLHIPRIIIPDFAYDKWSEIYSQLLKYERAKFLAEVLGIPSEEGSREISEADLKRICTLGPPQVPQGKAIGNKYKWVVSGCDWGGSDYQIAFKTKASYTVHAVLGIRANGDMEIIHIRRYSGQHYEKIGMDIVNNHNKFGGYVIGTDAGAGQYYNAHIRSRIPASRHLILGYAGPNTAPISVSASGAQYNQYLINKTEAVTSLLDAIKRSPTPRITCFDWSSARDFLSEILNAWRVPAENLHGRRFFRWIQNPTKAVDTLHALVFAYITARILLREDLNVPQQMLSQIHGNMMNGAGGNYNIQTGNGSGFVISG